jgi:hypothetical protein
MSTIMNIIPAIHAESNGEVPQARGALGLAFFA